MGTKTKTVAETVDFENDSVADVAGMVDDQLGASQRILGIPAKMIRTTTIVKLASGVHVSVGFNRKYNGQLWMRKSNNGSAYVWADVTIIEFPITKTERTITTQAVDYRRAYNKSDGTWDMREGARIHLNTDRDGMLLRNSDGTFAPETNGVISCNQGRPRFVEAVEHSSYTKFLTTKHWDGDALVDDAKFQRVFDVDRYNELLDSTERIIKRKTIKKLMDMLHEDASDDLISRAQAKAEIVAHQRAERIMPRLVDSMKKRSYRWAHVLRMEGFKVFKYTKDTGIELSTTLPTDRVVTLHCTSCNAQDVIYSEANDSTACGTCGSVIDGRPAEKMVYVDRYARDEDNTYRQQVDIANDVVKALEHAFLLESGQKPSKRQFTGRCSSCSSCKARIYGQNQDSIQVTCNKSMRETMVMDEHWELGEKELVVLGGNFYLAHSEKADDQVGLNGRPRDITFDKRNGKGRFNRKLHKTHVSMIPVLKGEGVQFYNEPSVYMMDDNKVSGGVRWVRAQDRMVEVPEWSYTDRNGEEVIVGGHTTLIEAPVSVLDHSMLHADAAGRAGYEVPSWLTFEKLSLMYHTFNMSLVQDLIGDREFESMRERYAVTSNTVRGLAGDYLPINLFDALLKMLEEDAKYNMIENDIEADAVASIEDFSNILNAAHPLFKSIVLEEGVTPELYSMYPTVYRDMQEFVRTESNPRMVKAGSGEDVLMDKFDDDACIEYRRKWDREAEVYGVASFSASNVLHTRAMAPVYAEVEARREANPLDTGFGNGPTRDIPTSSGLVVNPLNSVTATFDADGNQELHFGTDIARMAYTVPNFKSFGSRKYTTVGGSYIPIPEGASVNKLGNIVR